MYSFLCVKVSLLTAALREAGFLVIFSNSIVLQNLSLFKVKVCHILCFQPAMPGSLLLIVKFSITQIKLKAVCSPALLFIFITG